MNQTQESLLAVISKKTEFHCEGRVLLDTPACDARPYGNVVYARKRRGSCIVVALGAQVNDGAREEG